MWAALGSLLGESCCGRASMRAPSSPWLPSPGPGPVSHSSPTPPTVRGCDSSQPPRSRPACPRKPKGLEYRPTPPHGEAGPWDTGAEPGSDVGGTSGPTERSEPEAHLALTAGEAGRPAVEG